MRHGLRTFYGVVPLPRAYDFDRLGAEDREEIADALRAFSLDAMPTARTNLVTGEIVPVDKEAEIAEWIARVRESGLPYADPANRHLYVRELED